MINSKYFMLNCKFIALAAPNMTYEDYLIEVVNYSRFFRSKCHHLEQYIRGCEEKSVNYKASFL